MKKSLVLAEKPSVAQDMARVLKCNQKTKHYWEGPKYVITWALGHLMTLAEPEDYNQAYRTWRLEDLPIMPRKMKIKPIRKTSHQLKAIDRLAKRKDMQDLIIATDAGREGELVARWIMDHIKWNKPFRRLWISSQTDKAIAEGFKQLKAGKSYDPLYHSALCRAEADWLIGLNATRALTSKFDDQLAAGRVQTPTLAMLVEREDEIKAFQPRNYWTVQADFGSFRAEWEHKETQEKRIFNEQGTRSLIRHVAGAQGIIVDIRSKTEQEPPPLPYDLTELQREANRIHGFSAKHTLSTLQRLYERYKLVTYPRTDSRYITKDMVSTLQSRLQQMSVEPYRSLINDIPGQPRCAKRVINDAKVTDHHAIIPTEQPLKGVALNGDEQKLYDMIARRFIALFYEPHRTVQQTYIIDIEGERFVAKGRKVLEEGWRKAQGLRSAEEVQLPTAAQGDMVTLVEADCTRQQTKPPGKYSEGQLLSVMEKHQLGTPATRADIIEKLLKTNSIERRGNHLEPTAKGRQLMDLVVDDLRSPTLTADWEKQLEAIARGTGDQNRFLKDIYNQTETIVGKIKDSRQSYQKSYAKKLSRKRCPHCKKKLEIRQGKKGPFLQCKPCQHIEQMQKGKGVQSRDTNKMVRKYSDDVTLGNNLGDALKKALEEQKEK